MEVPPGWRFTLPAGGPRAGREVFAELLDLVGYLKSLDGSHPHAMPQKTGEKGMRMKH
jgi:hypothetical protein